MKTYHIIKANLDNGAYVAFTVLDNGKIVAKACWTKEDISFVIKSVLNTIKIWNVFGDEIFDSEGNVNTDKIDRERWNKAEFEEVDYIQHILSDSVFLEDKAKNDSFRKIYNEEITKYENTKTKEK